MKELADQLISKGGFPYGAEADALHVAVAAVMRIKPMHKDEIIAEVWRNRDAYAEKHHHSLAEIVADLQLRQKKRECKLVDRRDRTKASSRPRSSAVEA